MSKWANEQMGKWAAKRGQMGSEAGANEQICKWANGQMGKYADLQILRYTQDDMACIERSEMMTLLKSAQAQCC